MGKPPNSWQHESPVDASFDYFEEGLEVLEIAGQIKWFDASKGYGFITPDTTDGDVLLHVTCLRAGGYSTAYEGARVHCQVLKRPHGLQAFRILSMDEATAIHPSQLPQRTHVIVEPESDWENALVKWYNNVRGFGFLTRGDGTPDIFVASEVLQRNGFSELKPGQLLQVRWGHGYKGCMAAELRRVLEPSSTVTEQVSDLLETVRPLELFWLPSDVGLSNVFRATIKALAGGNADKEIELRQKLDETVLEAKSLSLDERE